MALNKRNVYKPGDDDSPPVTQSAAANQVMEPPVASSAQTKTDRAESPSLPSEDNTILAMALNEAARLIVDQMPEKLPQIMREVADQQSIPLWMLVVGLLQKCYDAGEHTAPVLDPSWMHTNAAVQKDHGNTICACGCNEPFHRRWPGQLYKDNAHGVRAAKSGAAAHIRADSVVRPPVGKEPEGAPRSSIHQREGQPAPFGSYDPNIGPPIEG